MAGYTGTPESNDLITQLMGILQKNRNERQAAEQNQARLNASSGFAAGLKGGMGGKKEEPAAAPAEKRDPLISPAGGTSAQRVGIGQRYIAAQKANTAREDELLNSNPYGMYLKENDTPGAPPTDAGALEEQKKRFTQRLMMQRGQGGGPLGGAGAAPELNTPTTAGMDPSVVNAVSGAGGPVPQMSPAAPAAAPATMATPGAAQGLPQPDYAMLDWAAARQARGAVSGP